MKKILVGLSLIIACSSNQSEKPFKEIIVGEWKEVTPEYFCTYQYRDDGIFYSEENFELLGKDIVVKIKGTWNIEDSDLVESVLETTHSKLFPLNSKSKTKINVLSKDLMVITDPEQTLRMFRKVSSNNSNSPKIEMRIASEIKLTKSINGLDGRLQLLIDKKIPVDFSDFTISDDTEELQLAKLRIVNSAGVSIAETHLDRSVAFFDTTATVRGWYPLNVDYSAGFGSYNGMVTSFLTVKNSQIQWLHATNKANGESVKIALMSSLKTDWRINRTPDSINILQMACRPINSNSEEQEFVLIYTKYYFIGDHLTFKEKKEYGFWEAESFPDLTKFNF